MKTDLFGEVRIVEGYDPDDEPGPQGITFNKLKRLLEVNVEDGWAKWKIDRYNNAIILKAKVESFFPLKSSLNARSIRLHQIIWVFAHNGNWCWPPDELDHKDGNDANNKIVNLRKCSHRQNMTNQSMCNRNTSGYPGVYWSSKKQWWYVLVFIRRKRIFLGRFINYDVAVAARRAGEIKYCGEYSRDASRGPFKYDGPNLFP
jgi:hypothetical protein